MDRGGGPWQIAVIEATYADAQLGDPKQTMTDRPRILVVEDAKFFSNLVCRAIAARMEADVVPVASLAETQAAVGAGGVPFTLALVDLVLPDAREGDAVEWLLAQSVPCIVFTALFSEEMREKLLARSVIDYVVKDTPSSLDYLMGLVERLHRNRATKVLVVEDSRTARKFTADLLRGYQFQVLEAADGKEGLVVLHDNPDVRMVITDYNMPEMDGVTMVRQMRKTHPQDRMAIIGLSTSTDSSLSARFIKYGANDFIIKPYQREEFFCRIMQNLRVLDMVERLTDMATKDALTGIHNRRHFFEAGTALFDRTGREGQSLTAAMLDVDFFKKVNDTHGHDGGDVVLKRVAALVRGFCPTRHLVARFGGEEFAILAFGLEAEEVALYFENLRAALQAEEIVHAGKTIPVTASFGVCHGRRTNLDAMLKAADEMLYRAKQNGRNRVEITAGDG